MHENGEYVGTIYVLDKAANRRSRISEKKLRVT